MGEVPVNDAFNHWISGLRIGDQQQKCVVDSKTYSVQMKNLHLFLDHISIDIAFWHIPFEDWQ